MKRTWWAALALGMSSVFPVSANAAPIGVVTSNPGSIYHSIGTAVAKVVNDAGVPATVQPATSPNQYLPLISAGEFDIGPVNLQEASYAYQGGGWFDGRPNPGLRLISLLFPLRVTVFVRADSDMKTFTDLKGKRMTAGYTAQKTIVPQLAAMYATAGMSADDMVSVPVPSVVGGANAFMSGKADAFMFAIGAGKVREADAAVGGIRALAIENHDGAEKAAKQHWPVGYLTLVQPGKAAGPGIKEPTWMLTYPQAIVGGEKTSDDVAYRVAKAMYEGKDKLAAILPPFRNFDPAEMAGPNGGVPWPPGAVRFSREVGLMK
ncbi:MAG: TAXI family TRAP transporter solute-binding subunit [Burkholderiaceae bacterium]